MDIDQRQETNEKTGQPKWTEIWDSIRAEAMDRQSSPPQDRKGKHRIRRQANTETNLKRREMGFDKGGDVKND